MSKPKRFGFQEGQPHVVPVRQTAQHTITWSTEWSGWRWVAPGWEIGRVRAGGLGGHPAGTRSEYHLNRVSEDGQRQVVDIVDSLGAAKRRAEELSE
ncbi:MAG TPA: hypothetical protein VGH72_33845 [Pseudonocardia sp.]|jgi:hypothetical protein